MNQTRLRIGGLGPLSAPGIAAAGRDLLDGMQLAVKHVNAAAGRSGRAVEVIFEDSCGSAAASLDAVTRLTHRGVQAFAGEYHSVSADAILDKVDGLKLPFVCASATLDTITSRRMSSVFRIAPPHSYAWQIYASFIASSGVGRVFAVVDGGSYQSYWAAGARVIESRLLESDIPFTVLQVDSPDAVAQAVRELLESVSRQAARHMLLLLVGYPEKLRSVLKEIRNEPALWSSLLLGDPAGRTIFREWWEVAGADAVKIPFLSYEHPKKLTEQGKRAVAEFQREYRREPTFVALEGYDSILALGSAVQAAGTTDPAELCSALRHINVEGTRGTIRFSTEPEGVVHQQWKWAPTCVLAFQHAYQKFSESHVLWDAETAGATGSS